MMPVHYYVRLSPNRYSPRPRRHRSYSNLCIENTEISESEKSGESSDSENEGSPKHIHRQRSRSISGYISQFFGMSVKDSDTDAKEDDPDLAPVYGSDLELVRKSLTVKRVPLLIEDICSIIEEKYLCTPGLYSEFERKKQIRNVISMVKSEYDYEKLAEMEPKILGSLLKAFLKGLKTPVLGEDLAGMIITAGEYTDLTNAQKMKLFAHEKKQMSKSSQATLHYLILHFNKVLQHANENRSSLNVLCSNFASSFFPGFVTPVMKKNPAAMQFMIVYYTMIFPPSDTKPETPQ